MVDGVISAQLALLQQLRDEGMLTDEQYRAKVAALQAGVSGPPPGNQIHSGGGAVAQDVSVRDGDFVGRDKSIHNYYLLPAAPAPDATDDATALHTYLSYVLEEHARLQLQGIRSASGLVSIALEEVYVTLTATLRKPLRDEAAWVAELARLAPGEVKRRPPFASPLSGGIEGGVQQVKVPVQEALKTHPRLVVLGDPGCGKTTLLRYLAITYARDFTEHVLRASDGAERQTSALKWVQERLDLDELRLPVLLPLRDFARYLEKECPDVGADGPKLLLDYLRLYFTNQNLALPPDFFAARLRAGECAVFFDGVDEVASMTTRQRVSRILEKFTLAYPANRYVVTSRIVGYTGGARLGADYAVTMVRDFTDADIACFAQHWNRAVEIVLAGGETEYVRRKAEQEAAKLIAAIQNNARVRELAVNPLLLTVIALVQRYRAQLPDRRVELYEEAIEVLLVQWDAVKGLPATEVLQGLELDAGDRRSLLEPVALWLMEQRAREIELDDLRRQLAQPFQAMLKDWRLTSKAVDGFINLINARSGLLTERGQGIYAFSHLTFQEHLAARAVADRPDNIVYTLARIGDSWWREVVLLEAGYLSTQGKRRVTELLRAIMEQQTEPVPYHNLVLAAEAVRDVGLARTDGDLAGEIQHRLRQAFEMPLRKGGDLAGQVQRRAAASEALGKIESGQFGAQPLFWTLPYGEPVWVEASAGEFWMGSETGDADERPAHKAYLDAFLISRVPITNAQYRFFVEDAGYKTPRHWEDKKIPRGLENHPVVYVTWYDAMAYCHWLTGKLRASVDSQLHVWRPEGVVACPVSPAAAVVQLPSEAEWEKAARGGLALERRLGRSDLREYPWGETWREGYCNSAELGFNGTTPVGIFPEGIAPYGCLDMAGNVWEWCRDWFNGQEYALRTEQIVRNPQGPESGTYKVLRGGSYYNNASRVRCISRHFVHPSIYLFDGLGFRVVRTARA